MNKIIKDIVAFSLLCILIYISCVVPALASIIIIILGIIGVLKAIIDDKEAKNK